MFYRRRFLVLVWVGAFLYTWQGPAVGQQNPTTADQVIANYVQAIGGSERIASITTLTEEGEMSGDLSGFVRPFAPPTLRKDSGTFEFYFKAPNLRFYFLHRKNEVAVMHGCDGKTAWYVGPDAVPKEFKPKPGSEYECETGYAPMPLLIQPPNLRLQLKGKKKIGDRMAWAVRVQDPKSPSTDTYYFDTESYLLLRWETFGALLASMGPNYSVERSYSDYRDVGGIKIAFMITKQAENSALVTVLQHVEINAPVDDARFQEPKIQQGSGIPKVLLEAPPAGPEAHAENQPSVQPGRAEPPAANKSAETHPAPDLSSQVTTNFVTSSIPELQQIVPDLRGLSVADQPLALPVLLDKIGDRTLELSRKVPNLICHEEVVESHFGAKATKENFSYLILARRSHDALTLEEFRVDLKSGERLETDEAWKPDAANTVVSSSRLNDLARSSQRLNVRMSGGPPLSQGFASMWVRFYPSNRSEAAFRYLGQQKIDGRRTWVLAFAQRPGAVRLPAEVQFSDKSVPIYYQGVAWVDASDFRIVRLRTDLLPTIEKLPLTQLTAEVQFADTQAAGFSAPLWLPREVAVTSEVNGHIFHDKHNYSNYRSFQAHANILVDP